MDWRAWNLHSHPFLLERLLFILAQFFPLILDLVDIRKSPYKDTLGTGFVKWMLPGKLSMSTDCCRCFYVAFVLLYLFYSILFYFCLFYSIYLFLKLLGEKSKNCRVNLFILGHGGTRL